MILALFQHASEVEVGVEVFRLELDRFAKVLLGAIERSEVLTLVHPLRCLHQFEAQVVVVLRTLHCSDKAFG